MTDVMKEGLRFAGQTAGHGVGYGSDVKINPEWQQAERKRMMAEAQREPTPAERAEAILKADAEHRSLAADQTLMLTMLRPHMTATLAQLAEGVAKWFNHQGFDSSSKGEMIALEHSELSERLEAVRASDVVNEGEEIADAFIRLLHYCGKYGFVLGEEFFDKMLKNYQRPYKHGKGF